MGETISERYRKALPGSWARWERARRVIPGGITHDGNLQEFKGGIMKILEREPVPVIPMALTNLWGSFFSRIEQGGAMVRPFRRGLFNRVGLNVGAPVAPAQVQPEVLRAQVASLLGA